MENEILKILKEYHQGAGKSIYSGQLERRYDINGSTLRTMIRSLRRKGEPIGSCSLGYYYCATRRELEGLIEDLKGRSMSMLKTVSSLERNREKAGFQQMDLFK